MIHYLLKLLRGPSCRVQLAAAQRRYELSLERFRRAADSVCLAGPPQAPGTTRCDRSIRGTAGPW